MICKAGCGKVTNQSETRSQDKGSKFIYKPIQVRERDTFGNGSKRRPTCRVRTVWEDTLYKIGSVVSWSSTRNIHASVNWEPLNNRQIGKYWKELWT